MKKRCLRLLVAAAVIARVALTARAIGHQLAIADATDTGRAVANKRASTVAVPEVFE